MNTFGLLMSVYNKDCPSLLYDALKSCDFSRLIEVIVVCDGPVKNEHLSSIRRSVPDRLLKLIQLDENVGLGKALNKGLKECSAKYIFRMDSDDICTSERFNYQINFLEHNECDILGGQVYEFDTNPEIAIASRHVPVDSTKIPKALLRRNPINHVTVCYKREKILEIGSYHHAIYHEDYDLWVRAVSHGLKIINLDEVLVKVRTGNGFLERRHGLDYLKSEWKFVFKNIKFFKFYAIEYLLIRSVLRLGPKFILNFVYANFLRRQ